MNVNVINERDINSTDASRLVHNRFPTVTYVRYGKGRSEYNYKNVDYNDTWKNLGLHNASLTSLFNLKRICVEAKRAVEYYNKNPKEKGRLEFRPYIDHSSLRAAVRAGILTGSPAECKRIHGKYVNMDDPTDVIEVDKTFRKKATYIARPEVDYNAIIEELNKTIRGTLEAWNG